MKRTIIAVVSVFTAVCAGAQDLGKALQLYESGMYSEAVFELRGARGAQAQGIRALSALAMRTDNAVSLANHFINTYHESALAPRVRLELGFYYFDLEMFEEALTELNLLSAKDILPSSVPEFTYKLGYSAYGVGEWERAKGIFMRFRNLPENDFTAPAYYGIGYICYAQGKFKEAAEWFLLSADDFRFSALSNYYILECRFNEKDYAYVVKFGEDLFDKIPSDRQPHMARIMSESYLVLGNLEKARSYYEQNLRNKAARTRSDFFYAGEVLYMVEDWQGSVDNFMQMGERRDSIGQIASYQLGYGNIKLRNKVAAMQAFKEASELDFSKEIKEDAFYNYAKLAFDLGGDTAPFQEYIGKYGTSGKGDRIYSYIAMAALRNHDYEAAVDAYDHIENLDADMRSNYMKAYYLRAVDLMSSGSWRAAAPLLRAAAYYSPRHDGFNQLSRYYLAEAYYRDGRYQDSRSILVDLYNLSALNGREEGQLISYHLGYNYFKEGNYSQAIKWFNNYIAQDGITMGADAETRIADSYFFSGNYAVALNAYERQMNDYPDPDNLYPAYRAGVAAGLQGDEPLKIQFLEHAKQASSSAPYYSESMFELGRAYMANGDREDAERAFKTLRSNTQDPTLAARALLEIGTIQATSGNTQQALDSYKEVVSMGGPLTEDALLAIESLYRSGENPDAYLRYVNSLGSAAGRTDAQKEEVYFSSAEQIFLSGDYAKALGTLEAYLESYPKAAYGAKANYYLAECQSSMSNLEQAADYYQKALDAGLPASMEENATLSFANANYALGNYAKAYGSYLRLKEVAHFDSNREAAVIGLMRSAYKARQWDDAIAAAADLRKRGVGEALLRESLYVQAKSYYSSSRREEALAAFRTLAQKPSTDEGAEAAYILILDKYNSAEFDSIRDQVYAFSAAAGDQNYWLAKAFIVLGDCFAEEGNMAQAKATFESIRDGYTPTGASDDVPDQVELRLSKLR